MEKEINEFFKANDYETNENLLNNSKENSCETQILYRSIYIIKKKFEIYKTKINEIYKKFNINEFDDNLGMNFYIININNFELLIREIFKVINCIMIQINNPKNIFISNLYLTKEIKNEMNHIFQIMKNYLLQNNNIEKYNHIFFNKKIKPLLQKKEKEDNDINNNDNYTEKKEKEEEINKPIVEYDSNGNIIKTNEELLNENKMIDINKDDIQLENNEYYLLNNQNLYIETLNLIIIDFLQNFSNYGIIETNEDLASEINILFDKEILQKINYLYRKEKEKELIEKLNNTKNKELEKCIIQKETITQNIELYEKLLQQKKANHENGIIIEDMLEKLLAQKIWLSHRIKYIKDSEFIEDEKKIFENKIQSNQKKLKLEFIKSNYQNLSNSSIIPKQNDNENNNSKIITNSNLNISTIKNELIPNSKEEKRLNSLKEIFDFYSKQHNYVIKGNGLFSAIEEKKSLINLSEFSKFCSDFSINMERQKLVEIYKKNISNLITMNFKEFLIVLEILGYTIHESKKKLLLKKISQKKEKLTLIEIQENQRIEHEKIENTFQEKTTGNKSKRSLEKNQYIYLNQKNNLLKEISSLKNEYEILDKKSYKDIIESFYDFLGLYQKGNYKKKMKGLFAPFQIYDHKQFNVTKKLLKNKNEEEVKNLIKKKKKERDKLLLSQKLIEENLSYQNKLKLFEKNNKQFISRLLKKYKGIKYSDLLKEKEIDTQNKILKEKKKEMEKKNKISWDKLDNLNEKDFGLEDKTLFEDSYNSDDEELLYYITSNKYSSQNNINNTKQIKKNASSIDILTNNKNILPPIKEKKYQENSYEQQFIRKKKILRSNSQINDHGKNSNIN